jgi:hypothetical protein
MAGFAKEKALMRKFADVILFIIVVGAIFAVTMIIPSRITKTETLTQTQTKTIRLFTRSLNTVCHIRGVLPDPSCTPGVINPKVTQANIKTTICKSGYTTTIRPPTSYTTNLKLAQISLYGYTDKNPSDYEEDHLISLEIGGSPKDPKNLWPEPHSSSFAKDKVENLVRKRICSGMISLHQGQQMIAHNWNTIQ